MSSVGGRSVCRVWLALLYSLRDRIPVHNAKQIAVITCVIFFPLQTSERYYFGPSLYWWFPVVIKVCLNFAALFTSFSKTIAWQAWKRPIEIPSIYKEYNPSQKYLDTLRRKPFPASPLSMLLQWCQLFFHFFFRTCKTTLGRRNGGKGSHCPLFLSEIVGFVRLN